MASESSEDEALRVHLPADLEEWLDSRAADLDVDRETVLVQLVASYRAAADLDGEASAEDDLGIDVAGPGAVRDVVQPSVERAAAAAVDEALDERLADEIESALAAETPTAVRAEREASHGEQIESLAREAVEEALVERLEDAVGAIEDRLDDRLDDQRSELQEKLEDVRERVVQVKRDVDARAPADHEHEEFAKVEAIDDRVADVEASLADLRADLESVDGAQQERVESLQGDLEEVRERLQTVAWVASDLRDAFESRASPAGLERIKRQAAAADLTRATCEACGEGVEIGLLTEPACPHCEATVADVEPSGGFFGKPRLLVASQLEAGGEE